MSPNSHTAATPIWRNRTIGLALAALVYICDRYIKGLVNGPFALNLPGDHMDLLPFFDLTRTHNYGVSLGLFEATSAEMRWGLVAVTGIIAMVVLVWMMRERLLADIAGLALILGGAAGNIHDRSAWGFVLDYADLHIGTFRPFLIFNLADAAITIGVVIILARSLFMREKPENQQDDQQAETPAEIS